MKKFQNNLQELCKAHLISITTLSNVLDILEMSTIPSDNRLKSWATFFIVTHMEEIVYTSKYKLFVHQNPDLGLDITQLFVDALRSEFGYTDQQLRSAVLPKP
ncbi:BnaA04g21030D [Brassica napus]|uniref:(rape) hypothetical protein n=1 Tax=Brassica napus TaxID=3708 RepID=A0A078HT15_BRANA|nr:unnamed protein product [Brassica napus]CDY40414.1 BnaA04g21030D [Brassica napus]